MVTTKTAETKKQFGRKTGWCNNPNTKDPKSSHDKCDGIWNERERTIFYCPCECHDEEKIKLENAKKYKRIKKTTSKKTKKTTPKKIESCPEHPNYQGKRRPRSGCTSCLAFYESNKVTL